MKLKLIDALGALFFVWQKNVEIDKNKLVNK